MAKEEEMEEVKEVEKGDEERLGIVGNIEEEELWAVVRGEELEGKGWRPGPSELLGL
jgi:hypothetical protein